MLDFARNLAGEIRGFINASLNNKLSVSLKPDKSLVTEIDLAVEQLVRRKIAEKYPDHGIVGEELPLSNPFSPWQWLIDPIDGTEELVYRVPLYGTIIGLHYEQYPVLGIIEHPELNWQVSAAWGQGTWANGQKIILPSFAGELDGSQHVGLSRRLSFLRMGDEGKLFDRLALFNPNHRIYATCFAYSGAAAGKLDAAVDWNVRAWDRAATQILVEEAGGKFVSLRETDEPLFERRYCSVFGKPEVVDYLVGLLSAG